MYLFPSIDLRDGKVVRLTQGDYDRQTTYEADPVEQARAFEAAGASWMHVVDLDGARAGKLVHLETIRRICDATDLRVEVGGGVRRQESIDRLLGAGVERVVLGTAALQHWDWFQKLASMPAYRDRLVLGLDARKGMLAVSGWEETTKMSAVEIAREVSDWPLAAIVYTDIGVDGMLKGPNVEATRELAAATARPVVASGGVGTLDHLRALRELSLQGAIVGKAIYEEAFSVAEAVSTLEDGG